MKYLSKEETEVIAKDVAKTISDKKCEDVLILDLESLSSISDFFIIATTDSTPKMRAVIDDINKYFKPTKRKPLNEIGRETDQQWTLLDYGFMVVHLFTPEGRAYYELEKLWDEAPTIEFE